ncbi:MAG: DUF6036 family nucleotidyltransferase [Anaerolineales bacterium]|nr:DUF6036 family nucleotidyltransferase [Anaerolineales bacterium]
MDKNDLSRFIREIDAELSAPCEIILVGGAAMILHFGAMRATRDVDALLLRGDIGKLRQAVKRVAFQNNLPEDWLNDAVKGFADILPPDFQNRLTFLDMSTRYLRVYALGEVDQVAMKIVALREQDLEDLELLLPRLEDDDKAILIRIMNHVNGFRVDWALKIKYFLEEQGWRIE